MHGKRGKYVAGCRCQPCTEANRIYMRNWERHRARVRWGIETPQQHLVDATEARNHLNWLADKGIGLRRIRNLTGLSRANLQLIKGGARAAILKQTADRILAVGLHRFTRKPAP